MPLQAGKAAEQDAADPLPLLGLGPEDVVPVASLGQRLQEALLPEGLALLSMEHGAGTVVQADLPALLRWLERQLLLGRRQLEVGGGGLPDFCFQMEVFRSVATLLHDVARVVPQTRHLQGEADASGAAAGGGGLGVGGGIPLQQASTLKAALEVVLPFVARSGAPPGQLLAEYAAAWLPQGPARSLLLGGSCCPPQFRRLAMGQLVEAYEELEDQLVPAALQAVHPAYVAELPEGAWRALLLSLASGGQRRPGEGPSGGGAGSGDEEGRGVGIPAKSLARVLGRFMSRFLCSAQPYHPGSTPLKVYLGDERCVQWPGAGAHGGEAGDGGGVGGMEDVVERLMPEEVLLEHTLAVYRLATSC